MHEAKDYAMVHAAATNVENGPDRLLQPLLLATLSASVLFVAAPGIDLAVSQAFLGADGRFPLASQPLATAARNGFRLINDLVAAFTLVMLGAALAARRRDRGLAIPLRVWLFAAAAQILGTVVIGNMILKDHWGRARPDQVLGLGGQDPFTPAWMLSDACARNCAFVSGEAMALATVAALGWLLILPGLPPRRRPWAGAGLVAMAAIAGGLRVAMGRHFPSDVAIGALLAVVVTLALHRAFGIAATRGLVTGANLRADLGAGLRALVGYAPEAAPTARPRPAAPPAPAGAPGTGPALAIVAPLRDEAENVASLLAEIERAGPAIRDRAGAFEVVLVDDGSTDGTAAAIAALAPDRPWLRLVAHDVGAGQSAAIHSGVALARAPLVCTIDGDGQNPPAEIPKLLAVVAEGALPEGVGLVAGQRVGRADDGWKRLGSRLANAIRAGLLRDGVRDTGCGLKLFRRDAFLALPYFDHMHRFLPALFARDGWEVRLVDVAHAPRRAGRSKYGNLGRALVGVPDLIGVAWLIRRRKRARPLETELHP